MNLLSENPNLPIADRISRHNTLRHENLDTFITVALIWMCPNFPGIPCRHNWFTPGIHLSFKQPLKLLYETNTLCPQNCTICTFFSSYVKDRNLETFIQGYFVGTPSQGITTVLKLAPLGNKYWYNTHSYNIWSA